MSIPHGLPLRAAQKEEFDQHCRQLKLIGAPGHQNIDFIEKDARYYPITKPNTSYFFNDNRKNHALLEKVLAYFEAHQDFLEGNQETVYAFKLLAKESNAKGRVKDDLKKRYKELLLTAEIFVVRQNIEEEEIIQSAKDKAGQLNTEFEELDLETDESIATQDELERLNTQFEDDLKNEAHRMLDKHEKKIEAKLNKFASGAQKWREDQIAALEAEISTLQTNIKKDANTVLFCKSKRPIVTCQNVVPLLKSNSQNLEDTDKETIQEILEEHKNLKFKSSFFADFRAVTVRCYLDYVETEKLDLESLDAVFYAELYAISIMCNQPRTTLVLFDVINEKISLSEALLLLSTNSFFSKSEFSSYDPIVSICLDKISENLHKLTKREHQKILELAPVYFHALLRYDTLRISEFNLYVLCKAYSAAQDNKAKTSEAVQAGIDFFINNIDDQGDSLYNKLRLELMTIGQYQQIHEGVTPTQGPLKHNPAVADRYTATLETAISVEEIECSVKEGFDISKKLEITLFLAPKDLFGRTALTQTYFHHFKVEDPTTKKLLTYQVQFQIKKLDEGHNTLFRFDIVGKNLKNVHSYFALSIASQSARGAYFTTNFYRSQAIYSHEALVQQCETLLQNRYSDDENEKENSCDYLPVEIEYQINIKK